MAVLQILRGPKATKPTTTNPGTPLLTTDTNEFFVGNSAGTVVPIKIDASNVLNLPTYPTSTDLLPEGTTNKYFSTALVRSVISGTGAVSYSTSTGVISVATANSTTTGVLSSADWQTFNGKQSALGFTPEQGLGNPAGNGYILSSTTSGVRSWVAPSAHPTGDGNLHVPATGTTNNTKVLKSGSTAGSAAWGQVLYSEIGSVPTANASTTGVLSSADWNTFNGKQASLGFTPEQTLGNPGTSGFVLASTTGGVRSWVAPYSHPAGDGNLHVPANSTGNANKVLKASGTAGSYSWASVDWAEVTGKPTTLSGFSVTAADVTAQLLTGYVVGTNTSVAATDSVLGSIQKLQGQINNKQASGSYLTANQSIALSGDATGTGTTSIAVTIPLFAGAAKGLVPASVGGTVNFLRADGTWAAPPGGGGGSWGGITGTLSAQTDLQTALNGKEASLGNPGSNGYVLASTTGGTRSWVAMSGGLADAPSDGNTYGRKNNAWVSVGSGSATPVTSFSTTVGNGSLKTIPVTHGLNSTDISVSVWELTGSKREIFVEKQIIDANTVNLVFASGSAAPATDSLRVVVRKDGVGASQISATLPYQMVSRYTNLDASFGAADNSFLAPGGWGSLLASGTVCKTITVTPKKIGNIFNITAVGRTNGGSSYTSFFAVVKDGTLLGNVAVIGSYHNNTAPVVGSYIATSLDPITIQLKGTADGTNVIREVGCDLAVEEYDPAYEVALPSSGSVTLPNVLVESKQDSAETVYPLGSASWAQASASDLAAYTKCATVTITPKKAGNKLRVRAHAYTQKSANNYIWATAVGVGTTRLGGYEYYGNNYGTEGTLEREYIAPDTSPVTISVFVTKVEDPGAVNAITRIIVDELDPAFELSSVYCPSDIYSSTETLTNKVLNGKPVYRVVVSGDSLGAPGVTKSFPHGIVGAQDKWIAEGSRMAYATGDSFRLPHTPTSTDIGSAISADLNNTHILVKTNWAWGAGHTLQFVIEYTKIADATVTPTPMGWVHDDVYSTTETLTHKKFQGKLVYRKLVDIGTMPNAGTKSAAHGLAAGYKIIPGGLTGYFRTSGGAQGNLPYTTSGIQGVNNIAVFSDATNVSVVTGANYWSTTDPVVESYVCVEYTKN